MFYYLSKILFTSLILSFFCGFTSFSAHDEGGPTVQAFVQRYGPSLGDGVENGGVFLATLSPRAKDDLMRQRNPRSLFSAPEFPYASLKPFEPFPGFVPLTSRLISYCGNWRLRGVLEEALREAMGPLEVHFYFYPTLWQDSGNPIEVVPLAVCRPADGPSDPEVDGARCFGDIQLLECAFKLVSTAQDALYLFPVMPASLKNYIRYLEKEFQTITRCIMDLQSVPLPPLTAGEVLLEREYGSFSSGSDCVVALSTLAQDLLESRESQKPEEVLFAARVLHFNGYYSKARELYRDLAHGGSQDALIMYEQMCREGLGGMVDWEEFFYIYKTLADTTGNLSAAYITACNYMQQDPKSRALSYPYYKKVADGEDSNRTHKAEASFHVGCFFEERKNFPKARAYYERAVALGFCPAVLNLAAMYGEGKGGEKNLEKAFTYYKMGADAGYRDAFYYLAKMYDKGSGTPQNLHEAFRYYKMAADAGYRDAFYYLANMYEEGIGTPENLEKAALYYKKGAEAGAPLCAYKLAGLYNKDTDRTQAKLFLMYTYYKQAADYGDEKDSRTADACGHYGVYLESQRDLKGASRYFKKAKTIRTKLATKETSRGER